MVSDPAMGGATAVVEETATLPGGAARPVRYCMAGGTTIGLEPSRVANEDAHAYLTGIASDVLR